MAFDVSSISVNEFTLDTGELIMCDGNKPVDGCAVAINVNGYWLPLPDGKYQTNNDQHFKVVNGFMYFLNKDNKKTDHTKNCKNCGGNTYKNNECVNCKTKTYN